MGATASRSLTWPCLGCWVGILCSCWCNADSLCKPLVMCYRRRVKLKVDVESDLHKLEVDAREWRERVHQLESR